MKARGLLTLLTLVVIAALIWFDLDSTSPGELSLAHAGIAELAGQDACIVCHGTEDTTLSQACGECHEATLTSISEGTGLHGTLLADTPATDCGPCHREHHGAELEIAGDPSFKLAGFASRDAFDHQRIGYDLDGAHAELDCQACHENADLLRLPADELRFGGLSQDCGDCHESQHTKPFLQDAVATSGTPIEQVCAACHTTSSGGFEAEQSRLTPKSVQALALLSPEKRRAAHTALGFALDAPHEAAACAACHGPTDEAPVTSEGRALVARSESAARFLSRSQDDCTACHVDPHADANGSSCLDCHQATGPWTDLSAFGHETFSLAGVHAESACTDCHAEAGTTSTLALSYRRDQGLLNPTRSCAACHDDPHATEFLAKVAASLGTPAAETCSTCHATSPPPSASGGPGFRVADADFPLQLHDAASFALIAPHEELACASCHDGSNERVPAAFLRATEVSFSVSGKPASQAVFQDRFLQGADHRAADDCSACHENPHGDDFKDSATAASPSDCLACHFETAFLPSTFDEKKHQNTSFKLEGGHLAVGCFSCHERHDGQLCPQFTSTSAACADCHEDVHAGAELSNLAQRVAGGQPVEEGCARCHTTSDFHDVEEQDLDHMDWFGFQLAGAHQTAACASCHRREPNSTPNAREFGRINVLFPGQVSACATCHEDVHGGSFDAFDMPDSVEGRTSCARCHDQTSFEMDGKDEVFDHGRWTRFELDGAHKDAECTSCHNQPGPVAGRLPAVRGTTCNDCHADIHLGQFEDQDTFLTECTRCHSDQVDATVGFAATLFNHDTDSAFALDETHAALDCAACHRAWPLEGGGEVIRYKPLGTTCADCHGVVPK